MSDLSSLLKSDMFLFCSFILSHPLHFTFLIFFSPYLHKLLSFLLPLFLTTSLLLLAVLTFIPNLINGDTTKHSAEIKVSLVSAIYHTIVGTLRSKIDNQREEHLRLEDFEVFRIVFEHPTTHDDGGGILQVEESESESESESGFQDAPDFAFLSPAEELDSMDRDDEKLGSLWEQLDDSEQGKVTTITVEKTKFAPFCTGPDKVVVEGNGSEATKTGDDDEIGRNKSVGKEKGREKLSNFSEAKLLKAHSHSIGASSDGDFSLPSPVGSDYSFGSYGSMRKEKEWKRTLACKLFEERNNGGTGDGESEGMDLLWETTYEMESRKKKNTKNKNKTMKEKKKYETKHLEEDEIEEDDEEERDSNGQLCCLQALNFSTRKMNLGMGRPNLMKISKAIKGIGWLHGLKRHSKKVHNGDGDKY